MGCHHRKRQTYSNPLEYFYARIDERTLDETNLLHDDVIKWKHFPRYWPLSKQSCGCYWLRVTYGIDFRMQMPLLLTWIDFNPSMYK